MLFRQGDAIVVQVQRVLVLVLLQFPVPDHRYKTIAGIFGDGHRLQFNGGRVVFVVVVQTIPFGCVPTFDIFIVTIVQIGLVGGILRAVSGKGRLAQFGCGSGAGLL